MSEKKLKWHKNQMTVHGMPYEKAIAGGFVFYLWTKDNEGILYSLTVSHDLFFEPARKDYEVEFLNRPYDELLAKAQAIAEVLELL